MSDRLRQTELLAGDDWKVAYDAFSQVNFSAYDFDTIRSAMVEYIRSTYPEDFNDWIENQEFIFILDLLAYLGQSLAFRSDLNIRENFIDIAERRESIMRLARMINYSPKRNYPARGLLKLTEVSTNEDIFDSNGDNLKNVAIRWNSTSNQDWYEQFVLILNSAFNSNNPFGRPVKSGEVNSIRTDLYQLNSVPFNKVALSFSRVIAGQAMSFEVVNPDFIPDESFFEREPNPENSKFMIYRNDGGGNSSPTTGFFMLFKQGTLTYEDFELAAEIENRLIDLNASNINQLDLWVQQINEDGLVTNQWNRVPTTENVFYNSVGREIRTIFSDITRDEDRVTIKFGDGRFGQVPVGIFRIWYRKSNGLQYQIRTQDMQEVEVSIPYFRNTSSGENQEFTLRMRLSLQERVTNSQPREDIEQVRVRAPSVYYTQDRMVNGQDYNVYPLTRGNQIKKIKAVNRTYSGHSRFIDIKDPTGSTQNLNVFGEDGLLYREEFNYYDEEALPTIRTNRQVFDTKIQPLLADHDLKNFFYNAYPMVDINPVLTWTRASSENFSSSGHFDSVIGDNGNVPNGYYHVREGALLYFDNVDKWASVISVIGNGNSLLPTGQGSVILDEEIPSGSTVTKIYQQFRTTFTDAEFSTIDVELNARNSFGLRYDSDSRSWLVITANNLDLVSEFSLQDAGDQSNTNQDASWLLRVEYNSFAWQINVRYLRYVFESEQDSRFFFIDRYETVDINTGLPNQDFVKILKINPKSLDSDNTNTQQNIDQNTTGGLGLDYSWNLARPIMYDDGYIEPRRVEIVFTDKDDDGIPDDPRLFQKIVFNESSDQSWIDVSQWLMWEKLIDPDGYEYYQPIKENSIISNGSGRLIFAKTSIPLTVVVGDVVFLAIDRTFYHIVGTNPIVTEHVTNNAFIARQGRNDLYFQWKHFAPEEHRIDPSITNIIDIYVLTNLYHQDVLRWIRSTVKDEFPLAPTTEDLRIQFQELENVKSVSDSIVWKPASFKLLFGEGADPSLKANFLVKKINGSTLSNNEIKQRVIESINEYFDVDNWDFGDSFYFTELAAYVHKKLVTHVASIVIVPIDEDLKFGEIFQVRAESNELFLSTATVANVKIINQLSDSNLRIGS